MSNRGGQYRRDMMEAFDLAKAAWWALAEYETMMYATELAEYKTLHPMPNLRSFMVDYKASRLEAQHAADLELAYLAYLDALEADILAGELDEIQESIEEELELAARVTPAVVVEALELITIAGPVRVTRRLESVSAGELEALTGPANVIFRRTLNCKPGRMRTVTGSNREDEDRGDMTSRFGCGDRRGLENVAIGRDRSGSGELVPDDCRRIA